MNNVRSTVPAIARDLRPALDAACARIAPTFPLDQFIAVNPYWGFVQEPIEVAAARISALSGSSLLMPHAWYLERWRRGELTATHLEEAARRAGLRVSVPEVLRHLENAGLRERRGVTVTHLADQQGEQRPAWTWSLAVTHAIGQVCAGHFDEGQAGWSPNRAQGLYGAWKQHAEVDRSVEFLMGVSGLRQQVSALPSRHEDLLLLGLDELGIPETRVESYLTTLLFDISGWAAWCAYRRFRARLVGQDDDAIEQLIAVRLAWELLLFRTGAGAPPARLAHAWIGALERLRPSGEQPRVDRASRLDWLVQSATELSFQQPLVGGLKRADVQAIRRAADTHVVFCIDVRSEPFRRALEGADEGIETHGFAGFFGMPIEYAPIGTELRRPQLPGLLAPRLRASDVGETPEQEAATARQRRIRLQERQSWIGFQRAASSAFAFVESMGITYAAKLLRDTLAWGGASPVDEVGLRSDEKRDLRPRLVSDLRGEPVGLAERVDVVENALRAASLTRSLGRLVVFTGHSSDTSNNPHAAGLDCGACSGQSGEVNARVLAGLLNDEAVRQGLAERGLTIPASTHFLAAVHNTTTDEVSLFDVDRVPESHRQDLARLERALVEAGQRARAQRAPGLGLRGGDEDLLTVLKRRARDWSEVRPEWGLADNAAFVVAPRARTAGLDLGGRVFLHDYRFEDDPDLRILTLIMTAPMLVTNWINMQYYASTVDNPRYGSGDKVLHNVVGGHIGVFEGNGGDLRIGLPMQSVHDGERFRHTPLRLSVFIEAPQAAIDSIIERHEIVRHLVENRWLLLFRIEGDQVFERRGGQWSAA